MKITTIATKECEAGLQRAVASLRNHGNTSIVDVYVPEGYDAPECEGIEIVKCQNWWEGMPGVSGVRHNTPALAKPEILLSNRYKDGEQVLYFRRGRTFCSSVTPRLLSAGQERPIMAYPWAERSVVAASKAKCREHLITTTGFGLLSRAKKRVVSGMCLWRWRLPVLRVIFGKQGL